MLLLYGQTFRTDKLTNVVASEATHQVLTIEPCEECGADTAGGGLCGRCSCHACFTGKKCREHDGELS